jgi:hypothetical protein
VLCLGVELRRQQYDTNQQSKSEQWPLNDFCFHRGLVLLVFVFTGTAGNPARYNAESLGILQAADCADGTDREEAKNRRKRNF